MFQCKQEVKTYLNNYVLNQKCACVNKALETRKIRQAPKIGRTYIYLKYIIIPYPLWESFKSPFPHIPRESFKSPISHKYTTGKF